MGKKYFNDMPEADITALLASLLSDKEGLLKANGEGVLSVAVRDIDYMQPRSLADLLVIPWETGYNFNAGDIMTISSVYLGRGNDSNIILVCIEDHVSSETIMEDIAKWRFLLFQSTVGTINGIIIGDGDENIRAAEEGVDYHPAILNPSLVSDHTSSGQKVTLTAGTNLVFGEVCYMGSDGKMEKGDADAIATAYCWAMALATINENASGNFALANSFIRDDSWSWASIGQPIYLDTATAGGMTQTPPSGASDVVQIIGIATTSTTIYFNPQLVQIIIR